MIVLSVRGRYTVSIGCGRSRLLKALSLPFLSQLHEIIHFDLSLIFITVAMSLLSRCTHKKDVSTFEIDLVVLPFYTVQSEHSGLPTESGAILAPY